MALRIPVSWGELFDKLTILQIKQKRITDQKKINNISKELAELTDIRIGRAPQSEELAKLETELLRVNETLWDIEDDIRACERVSDFGSRFVDLARSVYKNNDLRAEIKYKINVLLNSEIVEEKSYEAY